MTCNRITILIALVLAGCQGSSAQRDSRLRVDLERALDQTTGTLVQRYESAHDQEGVKMVKEFRFRLLQDPQAVNDRITTLRKTAGDKPDEKTFQSMVNASEKELRSVDLAEAKKIFSNARPAEIRFTWPIGRDPEKEDKRQRQ